MKTTRLDTFSELCRLSVAYRPRHLARPWKFVVSQVAAALTLSSVCLAVPPAFKRCGCPMCRRASVP